jgi:protein ImuB
MSDPDCPLYATVYQPPAGISASSACSARSTALRASRAESRDAAHLLTEVAEAFSPRYERHGEQLITIDLRGLDRLLGSPRTIGEELRRDAADRGLRAHIAIARTRTAAMILALSSPGLRVIENGQEMAALAPIPIGVLEKVPDYEEGSRASGWSLEPVLKQWGIRTLGEFAALPSSDLSARLGRSGLAWQTMARGEDTRPLVPSRADERFDATLELEWPIEGLEPLSFVLTRLLEPLSTRLEARDRGAARLHLELRLVTREQHCRALELPSPLRDVRTLRTLALLDLESHPPPAAIDQVTITIDPTPGRVLQHTLFTRPHPTPEQLSTLLARLGALVGQDRIGAPALVDSYRPGAFAMKPFAIEHDHPPSLGPDRRRASARQALAPGPQPPTSNLRPPVTALRRCRQPVPARVAVGPDQRPVRVTTDRRGFAGGSVTTCIGPWRTSGEWWQADDWDRDEWDVALNDGAVYRIFRDRSADAWFIEAIVD